MAIAWPREDEVLSFPVQCETDPTGSDGVVVYGHLSYPIHSFQPQFPIRQPEELSLPVQCVPSPTDLNEVVVYDHSSYPIPSVENHQPRDRASCVDNPSDVRGGLEQQWSSDETHNQEKNLLFQPLGHLTPGGVPVTWWSQNGVCLVMTIVAVTVLLILLLVKIN